MLETGALSSSFLQLACPTRKVATKMSSRGFLLAVGLGDKLNMLKGPAAEDRQTPVRRMQEKNWFKSKNMVSFSHRRCDGGTCLTRRDCFPVIPTIKMFEISIQQGSRMVKRHSQTTSSKKLLGGGHYITSRNKKLPVARTLEPTRARGIATRSKDATRGSWPYYILGAFLLLETRSYYVFS